MPDRTEKEIREALEERRAAVKRWRDSRERADDRLEELVDLFEEVDADTEQARKLSRQIREGKRREDWTEEQRQDRLEELAHLIDELVDQKDTLLLRMEEAEGRYDRADRHVEQNRDRIRKLRKLLRELESAGAIPGAPHFTWEEAYRNSWYDSRQASLEAAIIRHAKSLEEFRSKVNTARKSHGLEATGVNIISWVRSPAKNAYIGGASQSRHIQGDATDHSVQEMSRLTPWDDGATANRIAAEVWANGGRGIYPGGSRHYDDRGYPATWSSY